MQTVAVGSLEGGCCEENGLDAMAAVYNYDEGGCE